MKDAKRDSCKKQIIGIIKELDQENDDFLQDMEDLRDIINEAIKEEHLNDDNTFVLKSDIEDEIKHLVEVIK